MRTIENRPDEISGEIDLLPKVQTVPDVWSTRIIRPWLKLRDRHGSGGYGGWGIVAEGGIESREKGIPR